MVESKRIEYEGGGVGVEWGIEGRRKRCKRRRGGGRGGG